MRLSGSLGVAITALCIFFSGCGGVSVSENEIEEAPSFAVSSSAEPIRILKVSNATGDSKYDELGHYLEIKLASLLEGSGRYYVVRDDMDEDLSAFGVETLATKDTAEASLEILSVQETLGATLKVAVFSSHKKSVRVGLRFQLTSPDGTATDQSVQGTSSKGAWGALAQVDREKLKDGEGIWVLDNSMLGNASIEALDQISLQ